MKRIVSVDMDETLPNDKDQEGIGAQVHAYTHGINGDPITLLAIVFSGETYATTETPAAFGEAVTHPRILSRDL